MYTRDTHKPRQQSRLEIVARFLLENETGNLHRNYKKTTLRKSTSDQQHRRVVIKCSIYW
jgi:hypothetical protein